MRRSKFNAKRCEIDGIKFDSLLEGARYRELALLQRAGEITELKIHPRFALVCAGADVIGHYEADFDYWCVPEPGVRGQRITEDCKGVITPMARWKMKHFERQYGRKVRIVTKKDVRVR